MTNLESLLASGQSDASSDNGFRCWVTAQATENIPVRLLQNACRIMADTPKVSAGTV
jgi:hypothetical protein